MNKAKYIKDLNGFTGEAKLYELESAIEYGGSWGDDDDTPVSHTKYIVVSAVIAPYSGPETYIFPANSDGKVLDWGELDGSYRGGLSHTTALANAGIEVE